MELEFKRAVSLFEKNKLNSAEEICLNIYNKSPKNFDNLRLLNFIYFKKKEYTKAIDFINKAIEINYNYAECHNEKGNALNELKKLDQAIESYNNAIKINPNYGAAHYNKGVVLQELKLLNQAIESYDNAIKIIPKFLQAHNNKGFALQKIKKIEASLESYYNVFKLSPDFDFLLGELLHTKSKLCLWSSFYKDLENLKKKLIEKKKVSPPFPILQLYDSPNLQKITAEIWNKEKFYDKIPKNTFVKSKNKKIRIGYYSADFYNHAMSYLLAGLFESQNKSKFEIIAFSFSPTKNDEMSKRITKAFDKFINVNFKTDKEISELSRELNIDIAVDLLCFTENNRMGIFFNKCAPIQLNYLGYPGTSGSKFIDYIVADKILIPKENQKYYSEKIIYLPNTYQPRDSSQKICNKTYKKEDLGLPENSFVFCCFNQNYKITPNIFSIWMKLLKRIDNSVLWLLEENQTASSNLKKEAEKKGIKSDRIIFAKRMAQPEHLARHKLADIFVDTFPYNAHTTCSDALWSNLPVITLTGQSFASRVGASILNAIDLKELITTTEEEYENLLFKLATDKEELEKIKNKLKKNKIKKPLFDTKLYTKNLETAYTKIYEIYNSGSEVKNINID
tara:strand:+ start:1551 stop:3416 length:1866 start_codon:yes stop_codon:yes gene_type:complete